MNHILTRGVLAGTLLAGVACSTDRLQVPNYQNVTVASASSSPKSTIPLLATGILRDDRGAMPGWYLGMGLLGREAYDYTPTENRNVTGWLSVSVETNTSFGGGALWTFGELRDIFQMRTVANSPAGVAVFTPAQLSAINGFLDTWQGLQLYYNISARGPIGMTIDEYTNAAQLAPFVSQDSTYKFIIAKLTAAQTELAAGGTAFPFTLHTGFAGFNTPATFAQFTSAVLARVLTAEASLGVGGCSKLSTTCYASVLTALKASFLNAGGSLRTGPFQIYTTSAGDLANSIAYNQSSGAVLAHYKIDSGVVAQPGGSLDQRFLTKVTHTAAPVTCANSTTCVTTNWRFLIYTVATDPVSIIRNEELILLRAEAEYFTGDQADALADINLIRTTSGNLAPRGAFTSQADFITELLYNRRESLMFEGHQWLDKVRFGLLNTLPIDPIPAANDVLVDHLVVPSTECIARIGAPANLAPPSNSGC